MLVASKYQELTFDVYRACNILLRAATLYGQDDLISEILQFIVNNFEQKSSMSPELREVLSELLSTSL